MGMPNCLLEGEGGPEETRNRESGFQSEVLM